MRSLACLALLLIASAASAAPSSNPAFLGIKMEDAGIGCHIKGVTKGSAAQDAGLRAWDMIMAIDGVQTPRCDTLRNLIVANPPGATVKLDVRRGGERIAISVSLSTRAEVLHRRFVGQNMESTEVADADDHNRSYDLSETQGRTTVLGWFTLQRCAGCASVFDRVSDGVAKRLKDTDTKPFVLAVTQAPDTALKTPPGLTPITVRKNYSFTSTVPLALAESDTFEDLAIDDPERIHFMVIDCRGIVRFVAPIAPGSDDIEAAVDEVLAAAEQAEHLRTRR